MTTACACFGRNENCRLCNGSGLVTSEVEAKVALSQLAVKTSHYSGQSDAQKAIDAATIEAELAVRRRGPSPIVPAKSREVTPLALAKRKAVTPIDSEAFLISVAKGIADERAAYEAEQAARSIANWHKRFPNK